jgi:hypothetical protein
MAEQIESVVGGGWWGISVMWGVMVDGGRNSAAEA